MYTHTTPKESPCLAVASPSDSAHLHLRPLWWGNLGVVDLDLSFWHLVQCLVHDPQGLPHLLHSAQISAAHTHAHNPSQLQRSTPVKGCCRRVFRRWGLFLRVDPF